MIAPPLDEFYLSLRFWIKYLMMKHKASIIILSHKGKESKTLRISNWLVKKWKLYLAAFVGIFLLVGLGIGFAIYKNTGKYYSNLYQHRLDKVKELNKAKEKDLAKAIVSFQALDESLKRINDALKARGLAPIAVNNVGGPAIEELSDLTLASDNYLKELKKAENLIKHTPIGKPYEGKQTSHFGLRHNPFGGGEIEGHAGLDFKGPVGAPIKATADGQVAFAGWKGGYGNCIIVQHPSGFETLYGHLSRIQVQPGQKVASGDVIGKLGSTGRSTGPHVHYEIRKNGERIDPQPFLQF